MSDRLVVMRDGAVRQVGSQRDLYERPADRFVADFVGRSSFIEGRMTDDRLVSKSGLDIRCARSVPGDAVMALRPERVFIADKTLDGTDNSFPGEVEFVSYMGGLIDVHVKLSDTDRVIAQIPNHDGYALPKVGDRIHVGWSATSAVFPATGEA
jgi:putative spermidine/putrescine transport system ATP-binding protein